MHTSDIVDQPGTFRCELVEINESIENGAPKFALTWVVQSGPNTGRIIRDFINFTDAGAKRAAAVMARLRLTRTDLRTVREMIGIVADVEVEMRNVKDPRTGQPQRLPRVRFAGVRRVAQ